MLAWLFIESQSFSVMSDSLRPHGLYSPWNFPGQNTLPFSRGSSQPRDQTQVSHIAAGFLTSWSTKEAEEYWSGKPIPSPVDLPNPGIEPGLPHCRWILISWARLFIRKMQIKTIVRYHFMPTRMAIIKNVKNNKDSKFN